MEEAAALGWWGVPLGVLAGVLRVSTPFLFVSLGECLTEKSGRINLGLEGNLVMGAMAGYGVSFVTGSPWLGMVAAGGGLVVMYQETDARLNSVLAFNIGASAPLILRSLTSQVPPIESGSIDKPA